MRAQRQEAYIARNKATIAELVLALEDALCEFSTRADTRPLFAEILEPHRRLLDRVSQLDPLFMAEQARVLAPEMLALHNKGLELHKQYLSIN